MNKPGIDGGFFACYLLNLILNAPWLVLVIIYAIVAAIFKLPLWPALAGVGIWAAIIFLITLVMSLLVGSSSSAVSPTGLQGKTTLRRSSQRSNSLEEYARTHQSDKPQDKR